MYGRWCLRQTALFGLDFFFNVQCRRGFAFVCRLGTSVCPNRVGRLTRWAPRILDANMPFLDGDIADATPDQFLLEQSVTWLHGLADSLRGHSGTVKRMGGARFCVELITNTVLQADLMRDQASLYKSLARAVQIAAPPPLRDFLQERLRRHVSGRGAAPKKETVREYKFFLDVAFMLYRRQVHAKPQVMCLQVDSSPQADMNWLFASCTRVPLEQLCPLLACVQQLSRGLLFEGRDGLTPDERAEAFEGLSQQVNGIFEFHTFPPAALGQEAETLADKAHALCWSMGGQLSCAPPSNKAGLVLLSFLFGPMIAQAVCRVEGACVRSFSFTSSSGKGACMG